MRKLVCKYNFDKECIIDDCDECKEHPMYQQGRADQKAEDNSFFNFDKTIEVECNKAIADERERIIRELENQLTQSNCEKGIEFVLKRIKYIVGDEIVRGGEND